MSGDRSHDHLNDVIDQVARSLTAGEPSASLHRTVRSRIDGVGTRSHAIRWQAAIAVTAVLVLASLGLARIFLDGRSRTEVAVDRQQQAPSGAPSVAVNSRAADEPSRDTPALVGPVSVERRLADAAASRGFQLAPPDEPAPLPFPPLSVEQVAIEPLAELPVTLEDVAGPIPLQVQRLDIAALVME